MTVILAPGPLLKQSLTDPAGVARTLVGLNLPRNVLWTALLLMAALQSVLFALSNLVMPPEDLLPAVLSSPLRFFMLTAAMLALTVSAIYWVGRLMGGDGAFEDVLVVIVWMQVLRLLVQLVSLVLALAIPQLAVMLLVAASLVGIYILVHFIDQAHRLNSLAKSIGVLVLAMVALVVALSLLAALFLGPTVGVAGYAGSDSYV